MKFLKYKIKFFFIKFDSIDFLCIIFNKNNFFYLIIYDVMNRLFRFGLE